MEEERTAQRKSGDILRIAIAEQKEQTNDNDNEEIERELIEQKAKTRMVEQELEEFPGSN